jgi:hypothetical protein
MMGGGGSDLDTRAAYGWLVTVRGDINIQDKMVAMLTVFEIMAC